jgi:hypothetical protein
MLHRGRRKSQTRPTTRGSFVVRGHFVRRSSFVVRRSSFAGAMVRSSFVASETTNVERPRTQV